MSLDLSSESGLYKGEEESAPHSFLAQTKGLLRRLGLRARKGLGQHFLVHKGVMNQVVSAAELTPSDTVIEVGPGLGVMTEELARRGGRVIAVELDPKLAQALSEGLGYLPNLSILNADILKTEPSSLLGDSPPYKVVANLPYYITSPVLRHFLEATFKPQRMVVMVQKEVGQSIAAPPGQRSLLSIGIQFYGRPTLVAYVPARSFYPPPKVDSAIVRIDVYDRPPVEVNNVGVFFDVVRAGFVARRKQLRNALAQGLSIPPQVSAQLLERTGIDPRRRAESLTLEEWAHLYWAWVDKGRR